MVNIPCIAYQKEPVWQEDPHLANGQWGTYPGTPAAGVSIATNAVSELPPEDTVPPTPIQDLVVVSNSDRSVTLEWTATGDDGDQDTAYAYDVRYPTSPITVDNFEQALSFNDELVLNQPPVARIDANPTQGDYPLTVSFSSNI